MAIHLEFLKTRVDLVLEILGLFAVSHLTLLVEVFAVLKLIETVHDKHERVFVPTVVRIVETDEEGH